MSLINKCDILQACITIEQMHTKVYTNITRQVSSAPGTTIDNPEETVIMLSTIAKFLFKTDTTWGKVISLFFSITSSLAVDLVKSNQEEYLSNLVDGFVGVVEDELLSFLSEQNGWFALHNKLLDKNTNVEFFYYTASSIFFITIIILFFFINNYLLKF